MIAQVRAKIGRDRFCDLDGCKLDSALSEHVPGERRSGDPARMPTVEKGLDLPVAFHSLGKADPTGALALARAEYRAHQGKNAGRLNEHPRRGIGQMLPIQFGQPSFEIIVHQRNREDGGTLHDANAQICQTCFKLRCALHVDRVNAYAAAFQIGLGRLGRQAEARPIAGRGMCQRIRLGNDEAALHQPLECFVDLLRREILLELANELPKTLAAFSYRGGERAIELAVKKELPVLGKEAHRVGRQQIDAEIGGESRNVIAAVRRNRAAAIACHGVSTRASRPNSRECVSPKQVSARSLTSCRVGKGARTQVSQFAQA